MLVLCVSINIDHVGSVVHSDFVEWWDVAPYQKRTVQTPFAAAQYARHVKSFYTFDWTVAVTFVVPVALIKAGKLLNLG